MTKKTIILSLLFLAGVLGFVIYGYYQATPAKEKQAGNQPKIEISPASFDFGQITFGTVAKYNFQVKNTGKTILDIKRLATSCGCTTAKIAKEKIAPGETAELTVNYNTAAMGEGSLGRGSQERIIYIRSNDPANPQITAMIYAYVK